ncbi:MAG: hypothetical protein CM15mV20_1850 [uncultured marine virus]|nr:MAG: hypothetical protein CM15mV20_1850 [uncultured marine virus]
MKKKVDKKNTKRIIKPENQFNLNPLDEDRKTFDKYKSDKNI